MAPIKLINLLLIIYINIGQISSCSVLMNGIGSVTPQGDVMEPVGKTLEILCHLDERHQLVRPGDSRNIFWNLNGVPIPEDKFSIVDNFTAALYIPNTTTEDSGLYTCYFNFSGKPKFVCQNNVMIGYPPEPVTDFSCISPNWQYLLCNFSSPYNPIKPSYDLQLIRSSKSVSTCPLKNLRCNITSASSPPYSAPTEKYYFKLIANNTLGVKEMRFDIDHYSIVRPNKPDLLRIERKTSRSLEVSWKEPAGMEKFPPKLEYRLFYRSQWDSEDAWHFMYIKHNTTVLNDLQPFSKYELKIQCRSSVAADEKMWSTNATLMNMTLPEVPENPPRIVSGSFQERPYLTNRTIIIYWQMIPEFQQNGRGFKYDVSASPNNLNKDLVVHPSNYTDNYAIFEHLSLEKSYQFQLRSANKEGVSKSASYLTVEKKSLLPKQPESFTVIFYDHGIYELSWCPPKNMSGIESFTLFWCSNIKPHPFPCTGNLSWTVVDKNVSMVNLTLLDDKVNYHFAISTNGSPASSGMIWATCIVPFNGTLNKMKNIGIEAKSSNQLKVSWNLDCSERIGIVTGFLIYYCITEGKATNLPCIGPQEKKNVTGSHAKEAILEDLKPFTYYKVTISAITRAGVGEQSDVLHIQTKEGAPSEAIHRLWIEHITNNSMSLAWEPPITPNGIITKYKIYYNEEQLVLDGSKFHATLVNLSSYSNYTLSMQSCTDAGCSPKSEPRYEQTKIGVPGKMNRPFISRLNGSSAVLATFDSPSNPNGPVDFYNLLVKWKNEDEIVQSEWFYNITNTDKDIKTRCEDSDRKNATLYFSLQAVNVNGTQQLKGPLSDESSFPCITAVEYDIHIIIIVICSTVGITVFIFGLIFMYNRFNQTYKEIQNIKIHLPKGLEQENMKPPTELRHIPAIPPNKSQQNLNAQELMKHLNPKLNGSPRSRNTSGDTRVSTSSMDELLQNSGDNKTDACSDGSSALGSVSTAQTTRSNLSSDSGNDLDSLASITPDVVFEENPISGFKIQSILNGRNPSPPKIDEVAETTSLNNTPAHYSKFAHYLQNNDPTTAPIDGYISNFSVVPQESGYVLPSFQDGKNEVLQYSQVGAANPEYLNLNHNIPMGRQSNGSIDNLLGINNSYSSVGLSDDLSIAPVAEELMDDTNLGLDYTTVGFVSNPGNNRPSNGYVSTALAEKSTPDDKPDLFLRHPQQSPDSFFFPNADVKEANYYSPRRKLSSLSDDASKYDELPPEAYSKVGVDSSKKNMVNGYVPVSSSDMFSEPSNNNAKNDSHGFLEDPSKPGTSVAKTGNLMDSSIDMSCSNHSPEMLPMDAPVPGKNGGGYITLKSVADAPDCVGNGNLRNSGPFGRVVSVNIDDVDVSELKDRESFS